MVQTAAFPQRRTSLRASFLSAWLGVVGALLGLRGAPRSQGGHGFGGTRRTADGADAGARRFAGAGRAAAPSGSASPGFLFREQGVWAALIM